MIILIDQDGPLADFEVGFLLAWQRAYPTEVTVPLDKRQSFRISDDYPPPLRSKINAFLRQPGFIRSLPPAPEAVQSIRALERLGHTIFICTSPLSNAPHCVSEKYLWVEEHLGSDYLRKMIITKDKTLIQGDYLIDDRPIITGRNAAPSWRHLLFAAPHNQHLPAVRPHTWQTIRTILSPKNETS